MKHELIDDQAKVWVVTLGPDGRLEEQLHPYLLIRLAAAQSDQDVAEALSDEIARTRSW